jgi:hypothetical protein
MTISKLAAIVYLIVFFVSCTNFDSGKNKKINDSLSVEDYKEWLESKPIITDKEERNDSIQGSLYRNINYKFRIRFPENWEIIKGDGSAVVIKAVQLDSGMSYLITVMEVKGGLANSSIGEFAVEDFEKQKSLQLKLLKEQNIEPIQFSMKKYYLNNFPAVLWEYKIINKTRDQQLEYLVKQVQCKRGGLLYGITLSLPSIFYNRDEEERFNRIIDGFVFEIVI